MNPIERTIAAIHGAKSAIVTAHIAPDADAISSSAALAFSLRYLDIETDWFLQDTIPAKFLQLLDGQAPLSVLPEKRYDLAIVVDTASKRRIGSQNEAFCSLGLRVLNIDHHISNDSWGDINLIDADAPSASVIVFELLHKLNAPMKSHIADLLLGGLMDDTGNFRFSNTSTRAFETAARLVTLGARPERIANALYFSTAISVKKLWSRALAEISVELDGAVGFLAVPQVMLSETGTTDADTEGLVEEVRGIEGTCVAVFMRELKSNLWKLSLRSKSDDIDVNRIAETFGGGGHIAAAGCTIEGNATTVKTKILSRIEQSL